MNKMLDLHPREVEFVVIDLETTGFSSQHCQIVEVAAVRFRAGRIRKKFHSLVYADFIPYYATRVHGIDADMLADAPSLSSVGEQFLEFTLGSVFVGHNILRFDLPFLCNGFGVSPHTPCVDTLLLCRRLFKNSGSNKLSAVCDRLGIKSQRFHRALDDATVTARLLWKLIQLHPDRLTSLESLLSNSGRI